MLPEVGASSDSWGQKLSANHTDTDALCGVFNTAAGTTAFTLTTGLSLAAYVTGQAFRIKMNATNTGASTLNVDGLGAKSIVKGVSTAVAAGDLVSGAIYEVAYDGTNFVILGSNQPSAVLQPLDSDLTAIGALGYTSGKYTLVKTAAGTWALASVTDPALSFLTDSAPFERFIYGLNIANNGSDATNDIDIATGSCSDSGSAVMMRLSGALTKRLDANWAAGTNQGMRNSAAAITNTTYHIYLVSTAAGTTDVYAHTSVNPATVLTALQAETGGGSYVYARRIASIVRTGGAIRGFTQSGDEFLWRVLATDYGSGANPGTSALTATIAAPTGIQVVARVSIALFDASPSVPVALLVSALDQTDTAPDAITGPYSLYSQSNGGAPGNSPCGEFNVRTNTSAQIRLRLSGSNTDIQLAAGAVGYVDTRGRG